MTVNIKVMRYEIACPVDCTWADFGKTLSDIQYAVWVTSNRAVQMAWDFQQFSFGYRKRFGELLKFEALGTGNKWQSTDAYAEMTAQFPDVGTKIIDSAVQDAVARFKAMSKDILNGTKSIPSFKRDIPIPIAAQSIRVRKEGANRIVRLSLLSRESGKPTYVDVKVRAKGSAVAIFDRLVDGTYALGGSKIQRIKSKWYVLLTYKHEVSAVPDLSPHNVMGVDLGVNIAAALAFNNSRDRYFIDGGEIRAFRARVEARRNALLRQGKYCGDGRIGHGTATHLHPIEKLRSKAANFRNTTNHRYAKFIVDKAVKHGCETIQMEDLTGVSKRDAFLQTWPYYDLQTKIKQKAAERGVKVRVIAPKYTSQRCSCCGYIAPDNRKSQAEFNCVVCGFSANADYNAARNIAEPRIEELIAEELDRQARARKEYA